MLHGSSEERIFELTEYSPDGTKTRTSYPKLIPNVGASIESMLHFSGDAVAIVTVFDAADRQIHKMLYDADDRVIHEVGFKYDERGVLIEEGQLVGGEILEDFRNVFTYDGSGRVIEIDRRASIGGVRRTFAYNEHGDKVQEIVEQNVVFEGEEPEKWTERYSHRYDEHGNWIERSTEIVTSTETRVSMIERRQLEYYDRPITDSGFARSGENS